MKDLIKLGHDYALNVNELIVLYSLKYPDTIVDTPCSIPHLISLGFIEDEENALTEKGFMVVSQIEALFKASKSKALPKQLMDKNNRLLEYIDLWPKMRLPNGKPARASEKVLIRCFTWFFNNYNYDWETVLDATYNYVTAQSDNGFKMCRTNQYFVDKTNGGIRESLLADYCELIINGEENSSPKITQKVV